MQIENGRIVRTVDTGKIEICNSCPYRNKLITYPRGKRATARFVIVGEAPGADEENIGVPFVGKAGSILWEILDSLGVPGGSVYVTNVVKCRPDGNKISTPEGQVAITYCSRRLRDELWDVPCGHILALGATALKALTGLLGITKYRGLSQGCVLCPRKMVYPTYHPAAVIYDSSLRSVLESDIKTFYAGINEWA